VSLILYLIHLIHIVMPIARIHLDLTLKRIEGREDIVRIRRVGPAIGVASALQSAYVKAGCWIVADMAFRRGGEGGEDGGEGECVMGAEADGDT
jgi:hypothetical protein